MRDIHHRYGTLHTFNRLYIEKLKGTRLDYLQRALTTAYMVSALFLFSGCEPSIEDNLEKLGLGGEAAEEAKNDLLLAKKLPIEPLLTALVDPRHESARPNLVDVLATIMARTEDSRILPALGDRLRNDPDPRVRAQVIYWLGIRKRPELLEEIFEALQDVDGDVRFQAVVALTQLQTELSAVQEDTLRMRARQLIKDDHEETRLSALFLVGNYVSEWVDEAGHQALRGETAEAESLLNHALAYHPVSKKANYRLGRHYFDHGQKERGLQVLRENSMLLEVPRLADAPKIDGHLDEEVWQGAAAIDTLYVHTTDRMLVTFPSQIRTKVYLGYTQDSLYMGAYCYDSHPEKLVVEPVGFAGDYGDYPQRDQVEFIFDGDLDYSTFGQIVINSTGIIVEGWWTRIPVSKFDGSWDPEVTGATFVGDDFWSVECKIPYGQQGFPKPHPGDVWGFNFCRLFRAQDYGQWVVGFYDGTWYADKFGFLLFK